MLYYYGFFLAQIQTANVIAGFALMVAIFGGLISFGSLKLMKNKMIQENKDKMASKIFVRDEVSKVETQNLNLASSFNNYKSEHTKVHEKEAKTDKEFRDWMRKEMSELREDVRAIIK
jgi:hypothetical protein